MANGPQPRWWPNSPYDFLDTGRCPSCFTPITQPVCTNCRLNLADPRATRLLEIGERIVEAEDQRQELLQELRVPQTPPAALPPSAAPALAAAAEISTTEAPADPQPTQQAAFVAPAQHALTPVVPAPSPAQPASVAPTPQLPQPPTHAAPVTEAHAAASAPPSVPPPAPKRRLTVPVLLLTVGVSLVSIAAIFFLTLAWFFSSIAVRALIIGGVTLATIAIATFLRRRSLTATAEGVAVIGVVLIALDVWGVRANDLFGTGAIRPALYAGVGIVVTGVLCRLWAVLSKLRAPDLAAVLAVPAGIGLLAAGLFHADRLGAVTAGLLGASLGALVHRLPSPISAARPAADAVVERTVLAAIGVTALAAGTLTAPFIQPDLWWPPLLFTPLIVAFAALHVVALRGQEDPLPIARTLTAVGTVTATTALATTGWQLAARADSPFASIFLAPVLAVAVAVLLIRMRPRLTDIITPPLLASLAIGGLSLLIAGWMWIGRGVGQAATWSLWETAPFAASEPRVSLWLGAAAVTVAALLLLVPAPGGVIRMLRPLAVALVLLTGAFATGVPAAVVMVGVLLAAGAVVVLARGSAAKQRPHTATWVAIGALGAAAAFFAGLTRPGLWTAAVLVAAALPVALARILRPRGTALTVTVLMPVAVAAFAALWAPGALAAVTGRPSGGLHTTLVLLQWLALIVLVLVVLLRLSQVARHALTAGALVLTGIGLIPLLAALFGAPLPPVFGTAHELLDVPQAGAVRAALTVALLVVLAVNRPLPVALRAPAAALIAPALAQVVLVVTALFWARASSATTTLSLLAPATWEGLRTAGGGAAIAFAAASVAAGGAVLTWRSGGRSAVRTAADATALILALIGGFWMPWHGQWVHALALAVLFAAMSVAAGWRRPAPLPASAEAAPLPSLPETAPPTPAPAARSLRPLLAWPAFGAAAFAWWSGLAHAGADRSPELYLLPVAVGLALFCAALVWLRRTVEASLAIVLSFVVGLVWLALLGGSPIRGTVVAIVAATSALALTWSPLRRFRSVAASGATTAVVAIGVVSVVRMLDGGVAETAWLLLLVGTAYLAAYGAGRAPRTPGVFAQVIPPAALLFAGAAVAMGSAWRPSVLVVAILVPAAVHLASALWNRAPFGAVSRWASIGAVVLIFAARSLFDRIDPVELITLPLAAILLAGAALGILRQVRSGTSAPATEQPAWIAGLLVAVLPSLSEPVTELRTWLVVGAATALAVAAAATRHPLAVPSALVLSAGALFMGARALILAGGEAAAGLAGAGAVALGAVLVWRKTDAAQARLIAPIAGALLASAAAVSATGARLVPTILAVIAATAVAAVAALLLRVAPWAPLGAIVSLAGVGTAVAVAARRFLIAAGSPPIAVESLLWPLVAAVTIGVVAAVTLLGSPPAPVRRATGIALSLGVVLLAAGELWALPVQSPLGLQLSALATVTLLTGAAVAGYVFRAHLGAELLFAAAGAGILFALVALLVHEVRPVELLSAPLALGLLLVGLRTLHRVSGSRTWPTIGPALALLTIPSLLHDFGPSALWRVVALGVVAVALVAWGAMRRLQAPLVLGAAVLLVHAVAQLWPWIAAIYEATEWWLWAGVAGILLILIAVRYEKQKIALRKAFVAIADLR